MLKTLFVSFSAVVILFSTAGPARPRENLIGTWKLVSATSIRADGERIQLYGQRPVGLLTYTHEGRMTVVLGDGDRKRLSNEDWQSTSDAERAEAFSTLIAYAGRYTFERDRVIHHVEIASIQNWVNTDQVRFVTITASRLTLRTPPRTLFGEQRIQELVWEKLK